MPSTRRAVIALLLVVTALPAAAVGQSETPLAVMADGRLPLEGTTWRLTGFRRGDEMRRPGGEVAAWLTLRDGRLTGSGGCTALRGRYAHMGPAISFRVRGGKRATCGEQTMLVQQAVRSALRRTASAEVVTDGGPDTLVLRDAIGVEHLRFEPDDVSALESGEWRLTSFVRDGVTTTADPTQPAVLAFRPTPGSPADGAERRSRGDLVGSSGCNGIVGTYARSGDVLSLGPLDVSDAPCPDALAAQESAVLGVLDSEALLLDLPADQLTLSVTDGGDRLEYVAGDPLEGTTWRLDRLAGTAPPTQPITLHLAEGRLSGEGPCGAYEGAYATDGRFLTFRELEPGGRQGCPRADRQRALLAALADTVLAERARPGLRLLDVRGRVVARFSRAAAGP